MKAKIFSSFFGRMEDSDSRGSDSNEKRTVMDLTNSNVTRIPPHYYHQMQEQHNPEGVLRVLHNVTTTTTASPGASNYRTVIQQHGTPMDQTPLRDNSMIMHSGSNSPALSNDPYRGVVGIPSPSGSSSMAGGSSSQLGPMLSPSDRKKKKLPQPIPQECKDDAYWERRKRNNESAKRSRELRRMKEHHTSVRVVHLEQENLQLRTEVNMLREEVEKLREMICAKTSR